MSSPYESEVKGRGRENQMYHGKSGEMENEMKRGFKGTANNKFDSDMTIQDLLQ